MASVVSRGQTLPSPAPAPHRWARIPRAHPAPAAAPAPKEGVEHLPKRSLPDLLEGEGKGNETDDPGKKRRAVGPRRWRRILRAHPEPAPASKFKPLAKASLQDLIDENLDTSDEIHCDTEEDKVAFRAFKAENVRIYQEMLDREKLGQKLVFVPLEPTDTPEEHLTASEMEKRLAGQDVGHQARHFAKLAIKHYNQSQNTHKYQIAEALLSNCFSESCGSTFAHLNFTARLQDDVSANKRLFFAELMLCPHPLDENVDPMCVLKVGTIDDVACFGGCHEIVRKFINPAKMKNGMDSEHCHACSDRIKHPYGFHFVAGHDSTKWPYYDASDIGGFARLAM